MMALRNDKANKPASSSAAGVAADGLVDGLLDGEWQEIAFSPLVCVAVCIL